MKPHTDSFTGWQARSQQRITARDEMRPSLLDRLTDDHPEQQNVESGRQSISHQTLRTQVLRDLQWLFNCINNESQHDLKPWPDAQMSVINFGLTPLAGKRMSEIEWDDVRTALRRAMLQFEPRIIPHDLQIRCLTDVNALNNHNTLAIEISGNLWCIPWPLAFVFRTELDLEHSRFDLKDADA